MPDASIKKQLATLLLLRLKLPATDVPKVIEEAISLLAGLQITLVEHLRELLLGEDVFRGSDMEGLFLKLALEGGGGIPKDVLLKLTLKEQHLGQASPEHLMTLSNELAQCGRQTDAAHVAAVAARAFAAKGMVRESESAHLKGFTMDHSNKEIAAGVALAISSALDKSQVPRLEIGTSLVWDLSTYDFSNFKKDQEEISETFQLPNGINAWLNLKPKGEARSSEGMAALFLWLETPAVVKWTWQSNSGKVITMECDFSKDLGKGGKPVGWGIRSFMPISETNGSITLRVLSVQLPGSTLRSDLQQDGYTKLEEKLHSWKRRCQELQDSHKAIEARLQVPRLEIDTSLVWDLSKYSFGDFEKDQEQISETFQLPNGINAWLNLKPKGEARSSEGMAALFLWLDRPAVVKWTWQSGSSEVFTIECDFSEDLGEGGKPVGWGKANFMPISETDGSITLRILSVQLRGSELCLQEPEDYYTKLVEEVKTLKNRCEAKFKKREARHEQRKPNHYSWLVALVALNLMLAASLWGHYGNQAHNTFQEMCESQRCAVDTSNSLLSKKAELEAQNCREKVEEKAKMPHPDSISLAWDLSKYEFTNFEKDQAQLSETFQLTHGVNAWLDLRPKGHSKSSEGKAALFLRVETPAVVKWTWQSNSGQVITMERDFSKAALDKGGKPKGWGIHDFMPISETNGSITLQVLSVHLPASELRHLVGLSGNIFQEISKTVDESKNRA